MNNLTDEQLVAAYLDGDNQALELLIQRHLNPVYNFVYSYIKNAADAEDVTQETFVKAWRKIKKFKPKYKFKTWLFTIAKNSALDFIKKKKAIPFSAMETKNGKGEEYGFSGTIADDVPLASEIYSDDDYKNLNRAVEALPENYRATLTLRYSEGLKFREIAKIAKESIETIKTRHRRALKSLKKILTE